MRPSRPSLRTTGWAAAGLVLALAGCNGSLDHGHGATRTVGPAVITVALPEAMGPLERPAVEFDHGKHTTALSQKGCAACHPAGEGGALSHRFARVKDPAEREALVTLYHNGTKQHPGCVTCHRDTAAAGQKSGPVACGQCHAWRGPAESTRKAMRFDASLHHRHDKATKGECKACHHVYDEAQKKLVYKKGAEESCLACHGKKQKDNTPSLRAAAHTQCIGCHNDRIAERKKSGPQRCAGCHSAEAQNKLPRLENIPRLVSGQKDLTWIHTEGARTRAVRFMHKDHEAIDGIFCTDCHHQGKKACGTCHTLRGAKEGGGVTLEQASHRHDSSLSCVGCHLEQTQNKRCGGCHTLVGNAPAQQTCNVCHQGKPSPALPTPAPADAPADGGAEPAPADDAPVAAPAPAPAPADGLAPLPGFAKDLPKEVKIDILADRYQATVMPHDKHVAAMRKVFGKSKLARTFHARGDELCSGCHHHSPPNVMPPSCRDCHGSSSPTDEDRPALEAAYHRQCIGCHKTMGVKKTGCTDCHAPAKPGAAAPPKKEGAR